MNQFDDEKRQESEINQPSPAPSSAAFQQKANPPSDISSWFLQGKQNPAPVTTAPQSNQRSSGFSPFPKSHMDPSSSISSANPFQSHFPQNNAPKSNVSVKPNPLLEAQNPAKVPVQANNAFVPPPILPFKEPNKPAPENVAKSQIGNFPVLGTAAESFVFKEKKEKLSALSHQNKSNVMKNLNEGKSGQITTPVIPAIPPIPAKQAPVSTNNQAFIKPPGQQVIQGVQAFPQSSNFVMASPNNNPSSSGSESPIKGIGQNAEMLGKAKESNLALRQQEIENKVKKEKFDGVCKEMIFIMQESVVHGKVAEKDKLAFILDSWKDKELAEEFCCQFCGKVYLKMELACKHSICFFCFEEKVRKFLGRPFVEEIKEIRCQDCANIFNVSDVCRTFGEGSQEYISFSQLSLKKKCIWCKRYLDLQKCFLSELECLHLCSQCYLTQVFTGCKSCFGCGASFNLDVTFGRQSTCKICNKTGETVLEGYRSLHEDHEICFGCINQSIGKIMNSGVCPVCDHNVDKVDRAVLTSFFNGFCIYCRQGYCISELIVCRDCEHVICETCSKSEGYYHQH